ncbi:hypothetical protein [Nonomuraea jiangxiensis]|uniref:Uncharacterized protein n=1 Tax=Nonomuraea jiangxiensis TaxID=633440 RepID=A0A1G9G4N3_9ACTN|nr:hypothetical protein [Nonomuraea jiangxiensis]SDK95571.1 hypothetical protein SAMN05421869_120172 [Nonomuraea jiangxiensis]
MTRRFALPLALAASVLALTAVPAGAATAIEYGLIAALVSP